MVNLKAIEEIRRAVAATGREVTVVAAAKTRTKEEIDALMQCAPDFVLGENRVQEFREAYNPAYPWHFIGQLQTNKVKYIIGKVSLIHSLDRTELADEIEKRAEKCGVVQDCLVEVNMGSEISKGGVELYAELQALYGEACGIKQNNAKIDLLSAGMTNDYHVALEYGANIIRVGRAIFGERIYPATAI